MFFDLGHIYGVKRKHLIKYYLHLRAAQGLKASDDCFWQLVGDQNQRVGINGNGDDSVSTL